jgi:Zn-dependent protease with chaperone function
MSEQPAETFDLQTMVDGQSPALRGLVHIATPAEQVEAFLNSPGVTPAQAEFASAWGKRREQEIANFGLDHVRDKRARNAEQMKSVGNEAYVATQAANDLFERASRGDYDSVDELFKIGAELRKRVTAVERAVVSVETSDELLDAVEANPEGWFYEFYSKYPTLAERLPTLASALTEWSEVQRNSPPPRPPTYRSPSRARAAARRP